MAEKNRRRFDWVPGDLALEEFERSAGLPELRGLKEQERLDYLVITAISALEHRWTPPTLHGRSRHKWHSTRNQE
jgi:hypothetical protein